MLTAAFWIQVRRRLLTSKAVTLPARRSLLSSSTRRLLYQEGSNGLLRSVTRSRGVPNCEYASRVCFL